MKEELQEEFMAALLSRMDAQTVTMIELLSELSGRDAAYFNNKYTERYDNLAAKFRKKVITQ